MFKSKILHKTMLLMTILISGYIGAILIHAFPKINSKVISLEKINVEDMLNSIIIISKMSYNNIEDFKKETLSSYKRNLKNITLLPSYIIESYYNKYKNGKLSEKEAKLLACNEINNLKYPINVNFFILNNNCKFISHSNLKYKNNKYLTKQIIDKIRKKKEVFIEYSHSDAKSAYNKRLVYIKAFKPWNIYIGSEKPIGYINKEVKKKEKNLLKQVNNIIGISNIGKLGTSFIFNKRGEVLVYQNSNMKNSNLKKIKNPKTGKSLYDIFLKVAKTKKELKYYWNKPNDKNNYIYEKILWIKYIPELKWYVATTVYMEEFEVMSHKLQKIVGSLGIMTLLIAIIISFVFFKKLLQPILTLSNMANSAIQGDYSVRSNVKANDEIGQLSKNFNMMIETIEKNIKKEKKIMEQSRLAQMGEIMSMIAHQWRQPLSSISSAVVNIQIKIHSKKYDFENKNDTLLFLNLLNKKLNSIEEYVQFLSTTVDDFRTFFKQDSNKKLVPLAIPINKALQMIETSMSNKNIQINKNFQANNEVLIYKNELIQVILNILKNSEDNFIEKNIPNPTVHITTKEEKNMNLISIVDNGGGIPDDILSKIFKPYFSTKVEKNGTGLGLYMSKVIIEEHHNGILRARNVENGINFEIILYK
ncbi:MAG: cache domain-containing protein [Sulfurospirillum sp.]